MIDDLNTGPNLSRELDQEPKGNNSEDTSLLSKAFPERSPPTASTPIAVSAKTLATSPSPAG
jgi:hypothetical protein